MPPTDTLLRQTTADLLCLSMGWFPNRAGGLNRYVYELVQQLADDGDRVNLLGLDMPIGLDSGSDEQRANLRLTDLATSSLSTPARLWQVRQRLHQADLREQLAQAQSINLHFALYSLPLLAQLPNTTPITFTFHGPWAGETRQEGANGVSIALQSWIEHRVYRRCDRFITLSQAFADILHRDYGVDRDQIHTIPGGINTTSFQDNLSRVEARRRMGFPQDRPILFTPRRLVQRMGIGNLLEALAIVKHQVPDVWLAIAGKGPQGDALKTQALALGLADHVKFLGYVPDDQLPIAYQAADLTVVPSQSLEGFGLILLESLASGTPVLSTPVGGMPEVLRPFDPNLVCEDSSSGAIADRLQAILTGQIKLPERSACRDYAVTHYDWKIIAPRVREVLLAPLA
jgi:glycosyltransferase involved in cell wall biosynthesis